MGALVAATKAHGLVPLVVVEFPNISVGGGFSGTSGESSSFREGFFDHTVNWIEIVLADGQVVKAYNDRAGPEHADKRSDLFWGTASSFGTLGVVTLLEIRLKKSQPLVELKYYVESNMKDAVRVFEEASADPSMEYLDGIVYARDKIVVCAGRQVEHSSVVKPRYFTRRQDDWFYLHVERIANSKISDRDSKPDAVDYIPLTDYLFRYDRGGFWVARYAYDYFCVPFTFLTRWILNRFMHTKVMYHALHVSGLGRRYIIQDVGVPVSTAAEFLDWLDRPENFGQYPIWLCPLPPGSAGGLEGQSVDSKGENINPQRSQLLNFGVWGPAATTDPAGFVAQNRQLEHKVHSLGGKKWLYAHTYYTEDEFWNIYNKPAYDSLRAKYHAQHLPSLYEKVRVGESDLPGPHRGEFESGWKGWIKRVLWDVWPFCGLYGVYRAWRGGDYLLQKESTKKKAD
ncbi:FAD-binding, type 2 [Penicillium griseofulvum]|uniref:FAD-binding, type 2 n=1 Tax=Penicillium patulum TaxID=5078 RepID=A0A135LWN7_PENPA|nr:FAD-binding, type 2 [Penicillium griseofulvum]KXG53331.1 FAD-binding, type 2 [Penicillium griseofulvum]